MTLNRRKFCSLLAGMCLAGSLTGCSKVSTVKEWLVEIATKTGEIIKEKAENLYMAVRNAFFKWKIEDGVKFDRDNPLEGICIEERDLCIRNDEVGIDVTIHMKGKKLRRKSEVDPWMIDRDALPEKVRKFWDIASM